MIGLRHLAYLSDSSGTDTRGWALNQAMPSVGCSAGGGDGGVRWVIFVLTNG